MRAFLPAIVQAWFFFVAPSSFKLFRRLHDPLFPSPQGRSEEEPSYPSSSFFCCLVVLLSQPLSSGHQFVWAEIPPILKEGSCFFFLSLLPSASLLFLILLRIGVFSRHRPKAALFFPLFYWSRHCPALVTIPFFSVKDLVDLGPSKKMTEV